MMNFLEMNIKNRSTRGYDETRTFTRQELCDILEPARYCPASINIQPLKFYLSYKKETNDIIQPLTGWARNLPGNNLPYPGHRPTAFIIILHDKSIAENVKRFSMDVGINAQTIALSAVDKGLNVCMIGNYSHEKVAEALSLPENLEPVLIIAIGKGDETTVIKDIENGDKTAYYRDENDTHYVPKRKLCDLIAD